MAAGLKDKKMENSDNYERYGAEWAAEAKKLSNNELLVIMAQMGKERDKLKDERDALQEDQERNLRPHKPARAAMWLWGEEYSKQVGGSMDFWDSLSDSRKDIARSVVSDIEKAEPEEYKL